MKVSIITIVFNNEAHIGGSLRSVQSQTYPAIEHIVIDGGSTDGTRQQIESFRDKLACYISEKDNGLYDALNKGIRQATGDIIGILHSDDFFYDDGTIQKIVDAFNGSGAGLVYANGQFVDSENPKKIKRVYRAGPFRKWYLYLGWVPLHTTIFVRQELFTRFGLYDTRYSISSDYEISLRWFSNPNIKTFALNTWVVRMRLGGKSTTVRLQKKKSAEDYSIIKRYNLLGFFTLLCKIARKIPQYMLPYIIKYK